MRILARHILCLSDSSAYDIFASLSYDHGMIIATSIFERTGRAKVSFWVDRKKEFTAKSLSEFAKNLNALNKDWIRSPYFREGTTQ